MNFYFKPEQDKFDLYDHNGDKVKENVEFSGSWTGDYPDEVRDTMIDLLRAEGNFGNSPVLNVYAGEILIALLQDDIEEGKPP